MPHKFGLAAHCATLTDRAAFLGSVNVARRNADGTWHGDQVDGAAYRRRLPGRTAATLPGAGRCRSAPAGPGSAIALALLEAGVAELTLHDADPARRDALIGRLRDRVRRPGHHRLRPTRPGTTSSPTPPRWACGRATRYPVDVAAAQARHLRRRRGHQAGGAAADRSRPARIGCGTSTGTDMFAAVAVLIVDFLLADGPLKGP